MTRVAKVVFALLLCVVAVSWGAPQADKTATTASGTPKSGGTLNVGLAGGMVTLDWQSTVSHPLPHVMGHVMEGLFGFAKNFDAVPELAESYDISSDGKVWTVRLRKGVLFHNGKELGAEDVVASINRWRKVGPKGPALNSLEKFETPDKYTVKMFFTEPQGRALMVTLGSDENKCVIYPKEVCDASPTTGKLSEVIGTGPYMFAEYKEDQYIKLVRFDKYVSSKEPANYQTGKKTAYVDAIVYWFVTENSTRVAGLESGQYDIVINVPSNEYTRLKAVKGVVPIRTGPGNMRYMMFNHKNGPTADVNFRKAVQAAIDSKALAIIEWGDQQFWTLHPSFYPPESAYTTDEGKEFFNVNNPAKAKEYLAKSTYKGEKVILQTIGYSAMEVAIAEQLKAVGINAEAVSYDVGTWVAKRRDGNALNIYCSGGYWTDPSLYWPEFNGTFPSKDTGFYSDETERVFETLARESDFNKRYAAAKQLQRLFYEKVATINLFHSYRLIAARGDRKSVV